MIDLPGYDAGKKIKGKKRHLLVDTLGLILTAVVRPANLQDRDGAVLVLDQRTRRLFPLLETEVVPLFWTVWRPCQGVFLCLIMPPNSFSLCFMARIT